MKFVTDDTQLIIDLQGFEKVWALKSRLAITRDSIAEVNYTPEVPVMQDFSGVLRAPGTTVPWRFLAGTYRRKGEREFWYVHMTRPGLLTIELKEGVLKYERIKVSCAPEAAQAITDWWRQKTS